VASKLGTPSHLSITREEQHAFDRLRRLAGQVQLKAAVPVPPPEVGFFNVDALGILNLFTTSSTSHPDLDTQVDQISRDYMNSLSQRFQAALDNKVVAGDFAIFNIIKDHVFPLLTFLEYPSKVSEKARKEAYSALPAGKSFFQEAGRHANPSKATDSTSSTSSDSDGFEQQLMMLYNHKGPESRNPKAQSPTTLLSPLPIISRIYPSALLLALRLLARNYPLNTITHSLPYHIRSLGATSYVLGTNTHLYNTFLFLRWNTHSSMREICDLLLEMERGAVDFDRGTLRLLRIIEEERWLDLLQSPDRPGEGGKEPTGDDGSTAARGAIWWMRSEQSLWWPKIEHWKGVIAKSLEEKGIGEVMREGPSMLPTYPSKGNQDAVKVWL
jgi:hypothetical protein